MTEPAKISAKYKPMISVSKYGQQRIKQIVGD